MIPSMFPHTVTLYNVQTVADPVSCQEEVVNHITVLKGVLVDEVKAVNIRMGLSARTNGLVSGDDVALYIPFDVEAAGVDGEGKTFLPPAEFWAREDKSPFWTLSVGKQKAPASGGTCFFVRGAAVFPELDVGEIEARCGGNVFTVAHVAVRDFGGLRHWEVGAN